MLPQFVVAVRYLGLGIDTGSTLKQEVDHLGVAVVTSYNERRVTQLQNSKALVMIFREEVEDPVQACKSVTFPTFVCWSRLAPFLAKISPTATLSSCAARWRALRPLCRKNTTHGASMLTLHQCGCKSRLAYSGVCSVP